jgi:LmbE family N-acetylglucosaminyl deacetylase
MKKVVVISAHPDDEVLGCGGTLFKHKKNGDQVAWIIVTNVLSEHGFSEERIRSRQEEIKKVEKLIGIDQVFKLDFPTAKLDTTHLNAIISKISAAFTSFEPEIIYTMNRSDAHSDHRVIFDAVAACTKSFRYPFIKQVLMYECLSETEFAPALPEKVFIPNYFVDISGFMDKKLEAMKVYESELGPHPFPRSLEAIKALGLLRGSTAGTTYAEAFQIIKFIDK